MLKKGGQRIFILIAMKYGLLKCVSSFRTCVLFLYFNLFNAYGFWIQATGMVPMMKLLQMPLVGNHHLGIDDTTNIARVLQRLIIDGSVLQITGRRNSDGNVDFLFKNRIQNNYRQFSKRPRTMN